jgi:hypothetical protein
MLVVEGAEWMGKYMWIQLNEEKADSEMDVHIQVIV